MGSDWIFPQPCEIKTFEYQLLSARIYLSAPASYGVRSLSAQSGCGLTGMGWFNGTGKGFVDKGDGVFKFQIRRTDHGTV